MAANLEQIQPGNLLAETLGKIPIPESPGVAPITRKRLIALAQVALETVEFLEYKSVKKEELGEVWGTLQRLWWAQK